MGRLLLVRHGQASLLDDDYDRLSPLGVRQAEATGRWLGARLPWPARLACGSLARQRGTLEALVLALARAAGWSDLPLTVDPHFDEYTHADLFGSLEAPWSDHAALAAHLRTVEHPRRVFHRQFERALDAWLAGAPGAGVTWAEFRARCGAALARVAAALGSGDVAVVASSGGAIAAMLQPLIGLPDARVPALHTPLYNASITQLLTRGETISLSTFNGISHLELEPGEPSLVTYR